MRHITFFYNMKIKPKKIDNLYEKYGYRKIEYGESVRLFLYEKSRYFGADIIPLDNHRETVVQCERLRVEYSEGGYATRIKNYSSIEEVALELYKSFFSYDSTKARLKKKYDKFLTSQRRLNGGIKYEYINSPFQVNNESTGNGNLIKEVTDCIKIERPQLIIIEGSAGYGKTCTAYELLNKLLDSTFCENPLLTVLSRNRGANIFRYILLDEIDREYPNLDSRLVTYEVNNGRIPIIIDGFDELLNKSEIVKSESDKVFSEVETMLDTIGNLLVNKTKIILTSRKTAIFAGDEFKRWLGKWSNTFDVTRFTLEIPRIKDWLTQEKLDGIKHAQIPVEYIANPVLLTYLRNLNKTTFDSHLLEPESIIEKYFTSLFGREIERQELKIHPEDQYKIFKNVAQFLINLDQSSEEKTFFRDIIVDVNKDLLNNTLKLYPPDYDIERLADKLINHAILDRKGQEENEIGFINDFVFGTFIGEIMSKSSIPEIEKNFSPYMVEIGATAYRVQNSENKSLMWKKIEALASKFESSTLFTFDITLEGQLKRNFANSVFKSLQIFKISFTEEYIVDSSVFINCKFKKCTFHVNAFSSISFIDCLFEECSLVGVASLNDFENSITINCRQVECNILTFHSSYDNDKSSKDKRIELENNILGKLYHIEESSTEPKISNVLKSYELKERRMVGILIDKLRSEKIIKVIGLNVNIEINQLHIVKNRIGVL